MPRHTTNIHERFLRHIWSQQYLKQSELRTADGKPINVLSVGTINLDGGPDFHSAKIKIGKTTYAGDVEIHRTAYEWLQHHHEQDPRYNKVVLHVVLEGDAEKSPTVVHSGRAVPVLVLEPFLSESIRSIWQKTILDERVRRSEAIKCFRVNGDVSSELLRRWLNHVSIERLELKLRRFDERLKQLAHTQRMEAHEEFRKYGLREEGFPDEIPPPMPELTQHDVGKRELWEQILYEGVMEGLGYSKNQEPFVRLAQNVSLTLVHRADLDTATLEAVLFGAAGLLPKIRTLKEKTSKDYARGLIDAWQAAREKYRGEVLHVADWQFFPTRPANFPTVRLSAAPGLIQKFLHNDLFRKIIQTIKSGVPAAEKQSMLYKLLQIEAHPFWSRHYHFDELAAKPIKPLGASRIDDIIVNTVLPVAFLYARIFKDKDAREGAIAFLNAMPPLSENSVTRLMSKQLLKGKVKLDSAGAQQGAIQLYKFYCTEERCAECEVGKRVFKNA